MWNIKALLENIFIQLKAMMKVLKEIRDSLNKMNEMARELKEASSDEKV